MDPVVYCEECHVEEGKDVRIHYRYGAWWCPTHRDRCHIRRPETDFTRVERLEATVRAQGERIVELEDAIEQLRESVDREADSIPM